MRLKNTTKGHSLVLLEGQDHQGHHAPYEGRGDYEDDDLLLPGPAALLPLALLLISARFLVLLELGLPVRGGSEIDGNHAIHVIRVNPLRFTCHFELLGKTAGTPGRKAGGERTLRAHGLGWAAS